MTDYNRSIFLIDMNHQNLVEFLISDSDNTILGMPMYGWYKLGDSIGWNTRTPLSLLMGPIRWYPKSGFIGWLADFTVWSKDETFPYILTGGDNRKQPQYHSVQLTRIINKQELVALLDVPVEDFDNYILWIESNTEG